MVFFPVFLSRKILYGLQKSFCLHIMDSNFVFLGISLCAKVFVSLAVFVSCASYLAYIFSVFVVHCYGFLVSLYLVWLLYLLYYYIPVGFQRERERAEIWVGEVMQRMWEDSGEEKS